jgi:tetratricopeptide (TPR) repeat protein
MSNQNSVAERVGQAWHHHREGRNDAAIAEFQTILKQNPSDIDANYGLGLAQKNLGHFEAARAAFQTTLSLVEAARDAYTAERREHGDSNIKTPEDDRFQMLSRMVKQRLSELDRT